MKKLDTLCDTAAKKIVQHTLQNAMEGKFAGQKVNLTLQF